MKKIVILILCGLMGGHSLFADNLKKQDPSLVLSQVQKNKLRDITNQYAEIVLQDNGLKKEILEQFKQEIERVCVADDETNVESNDSPETKRAVFAKWFIGGIVAACAGIIIYELIKQWTKSPQDKLLDLVHKILNLRQQLATGDRPSTDSAIAQLFQFGDRVDELLPHINLTLDEVRAFGQRFGELDRDLTNAHGDRTLINVAAHNLVEGVERLLGPSRGRSEPVVASTLDRNRAMLEGVSSVHRDDLLGMIVANRMAALAHALA